MAGRVQDVFLDAAKNRGFLGFCCPSLDEATRNGGDCFVTYTYRYAKMPWVAKSLPKKNTTAIDNPLGKEISLPTRHILVSYMNLSGSFLFRSSVRYRMSFAWEISQPTYKVGLQKNPALGGSPDLVSS